jgi:hypothetical protein
MTRDRFARMLERSGTTVDLDELYSAPIRNLLTTSNPKTLKGLKKGYSSAILHLSPADRSGFNTCPKATAGCRAACLNTAGRGGMGLERHGDNAVQRARRRKTHLYFARRDDFMRALVADINRHVRKSERAGLVPTVRLNGTSDIRWELVPVDGYSNIFERFPDVQFYDYTKIPGRPLDIPNYHLTFSVADGNDRDAELELARGANVAVVFDVVPDEYLGAPVIDGDESDLRFLDPPGAVVGLYAKGDAKKDSSGFVKRLAVV